MKDMRIRKMVFAALMAALTYVATMVVQIPSPMQGYVNLGDCCVLLSGWMLGPWWGGAAAGIGSMLTDLLNGYAHYAPGTFVIKGCMAIAAALLAKAMGNKAAGYAVSGVVAEVIMVAGYFGYAALLLGKGIGAAASMPPGPFRPTATITTEAKMSVIRVIPETGFEPTDRKSTRLNSSH